jgi:hypothetical protein
VLVTFITTTLVNETKTLIAMGVILVVSVALDVAWKRGGTPRVTPPAAGPGQVPDGVSSQGGA